MNKPNIPPEAVAKAWDLVETLAFDRVTPPRRGMSALADAIGVAPLTLSKWEEGEWLPGLGPFVAWADALGYDVELVPREGE